MKCTQVQDRLSAFQDGELEFKEAKRIREHLESCRGCRERYEEFEKLWQELGAFKEIAPDPDFYGQLVKKINDSSETRVPVGFQWIIQYFSSYWAASALLIAGILAGTFLGNILVRSDLFPFQQSQPIYSQAANEVFSLKTFGPIPPGTLADRYMRAVSYGEECQ